MNWIMENSCVEVRVDSKKRTAEIDFTGTAQDHIVAMHHSLYVMQSFYMFSAVLLVPKFHSMKDASVH